MSKKRKPQYGTAFTRLLRDERIADEKEKSKRKRTRKRKTRRVNYYEYINSDEWKQKRNDALERANNKCSECGSEHDLHVHHLTYKRLGRELPEDLQVLCADCHAIVHEDKGCVDSLSREFRQIIG